MLTLQLPMLLALVGTVLMAVVIFAPAPRAANVTVSLAPPSAPTLAHRAAPYSASSSDALVDAPPSDALRNSPSDASSGAFAPDASAQPAWPALLDPRAACCDAAARLALIDALAAVRAPWAQAILRHALDGEPDALVRGAAAAALAGAADDR